MDSKPFFASTAHELRNLSLTQPNPLEKYNKGGMPHEIASWFAGPKAENAGWFEGVLGRIIQDYYSWRRNFFPEDGIVLGSEVRREGEAFRDEFDDRLMELLGRLKADFPFHSPRYAAHMIAEQTLPSIAAYLATMLYNPNNVTRESAPVTVRLELEASQMLCQMIGYGDESWGHLTGGGTVANFEALWVARTVAYLPQTTTQMRSRLGLHQDDSCADSLEAFQSVFRDAASHAIPVEEVIGAYRDSDFCVAERGVASVVAKDGRRPVICAPESHHYCFEKALDILGIGRSALLSIGVDADFRMRVDHLEELLEKASAQGDRVISVVAVVGTTEEGAVDPVDKILDLRARCLELGKEGFWLHADGAYGGYLRTLTRPTRMGLGEPHVETEFGGEPVRLTLQLPEHGACAALERLGEVDSVTIDPHKLGYIPYPAGAICFKNNLVKPLLRQDAPYLEESADDPERERQSEGIGVFIMEGSKPGAAAAAVWLSHKLIPLDNQGHGKLVRQTIRNACELHALLEFGSKNRSVRAIPLCSPGSNIVCFAFMPKKGSSLNAINALNKELYSRFTVSGQEGSRVYDQRFFISRTMLTANQYGSTAVKSFLDRLAVSHSEYESEGVFLLRSVIMNPWYELARSKGRHVLSELVQELYDVAESLAAEPISFNK